MTKVWIMSDLHDDFSRASLGNYSLPHDVEADVLVIAGDIAGRLSRMGRTWLEAQDRGMPIVVVPGNHDFWTASIDTEIQRFRDKLRVDHIHILDGDAIELAGARFVGGTLWTDYAVLNGDSWGGQQVALMDMNDHRRIRIGGYERKTLPADFLDIHRRQVRAIDDILAIPFKGPSIVVTHHAPSPKSLAGGKAMVPIDAAYASDLEGLILDRQPEMWIHGHIHRAQNYRIGETKVVCNPRGYRHRALTPATRASGQTLQVEVQDFDERLVVDVMRRPRVDPFGFPMPYADEVEWWRYAQRVNEMSFDEHGYAEPQQPREEKLGRKRT